MIQTHLTLTPSARGLLESFSEAHGAEISLSQTEDFTVLRQNNRRSESEALSLAVVAGKRLTRGVVLNGDGVETPLAELSERESGLLRPLLRAGSAPVAGLRGRTGVLLCPFHRLEGGAAEEYFALAVEPLLERLLKSRRRLDERAWKRFREVKRRAAESAAERVKLSFEEKQREIERLQEAARTEQEQLYVLARSMRAFEGAHGTRVREWRREFGALRRMAKEGGRYASVELAGDKVVAVTRPVSVRYARKTYRLGRFEVRVNLKEGTVGVVNLDRPLKRWKTVDHHPFVRNKHVCFGNMSGEAEKFLAERDVVPLLMLMERFLRSYNRGGYSEIEDWREEEPDEDETK